MYLFSLNIIKEGLYLKTFQDNVHIPVDFMYECELEWLQATVS